MALALSLPESAERELLLVACYIVVVFSIVVQGLTIESLVKLLKLDALSHRDLLATREGDRVARMEGLKRLDTLVKGGTFSPRVAENIRAQCERNLDEIDMLTVIVPAENADKIFDFIFYAGGLDRPRGGIMFQQAAAPVTEFSLPDLE